VVHKLHYSRTKLHSIYPSVSPLCIKCKSSEGTLAHLFWFWPKICKFWSEVLCFYSKVLKTDFDDYTIWDGNSEEAILLMWNKECIPKFETWIAEVSSMENIFAGKLKKFLQIWRSFIEFQKGDHRI